MCSTKKNTIITMSDDSDMSIISISDDDILVISSDNSIITISDISRNDCDSVVNVSDATSPSFDFETSAKMLLPQPRTSTPSLHREADEASNRAKKRK